MDNIITYCLYYVNKNLYKFTKIRILYRNYLRLAVIFDKILDK